MMRLRRASVIAALSLLAWAATAGAECAWVLWKQETTSGQSSADQKPWEIVRAVPKHEACEAAQAELMKNVVASYSKSAASASVVGKAVLITFQEPGGKLVMAVMQLYQCLPDTVDPRGPKTK